MKKNLSITLAAGFALASAANAQFDTASAWGDADPAGLNGTQGFSGGVPDTGVDIINGNASGTFTSDGTTTTITSGGFVFWTANDGGTFVYNSTGAHTTTGDFTASVTHVGINDNYANEWGRTTLDARVTQTPGTPAFNDAHVMIMRQSNGTGRTGWRDTEGGGTGRDDGAHAPLALGDVGGANQTVAHMSIGRTGNDITTAFARDIGGVAGRFVLHATRTQDAWAAGTEVVVGLGHQAHNQGPNHPSSPGGTGGAGRVNTATFENWTYSGSYDAATFGPAASPTTWQPNASVNVDPVSGAFNGAAFINENGGPATGEVVAWTATATRVLGTQPGLNANIYLAGNPGSEAGARGIIAGAPAGTAVIPNVNWTGGSDDDANYNGLTGPASFGVAVQGVDPADNAAGAFSGNQDSYGVHMTGEIFIPADADRLGGIDGDVNTIGFKDGIDDYTFLAIDGVTLVDDNAWTGFNGTQNNGSPIAQMDVSGSQYDDGEWVSFEMIMWEGGGGDAGVLYWDENAAGGFPAIQTDPATTDAIVPGANFRSDLLGVTLTAEGFTELDGATGLTLGAGDWLVSLTAENTGAAAGDSALVTVIPEPSAVSLLALASLGLLRRRRK